MTLQEVQAGTTSSEFVEWIRFMEEDEKTLTVTHTYLAQVAAEVRRGYVKNPQNVQVTDLLIDFKEKAVSLSREEMLDRSQAFWFGALGIRKK